MEKAKHEHPPRTRTRLTRKVVNDALVRGPGKRARIWDAEFPNLYLLLTATGHVTYYLRYFKPSGVKADFAIGRADIVTPEEAREAARSALADLILNGVSPVERRKERRDEARRQRLQTFAAMADQFWADKASKASTLNRWKSPLNRHVLPRLGKRPITDVSSSEVRNILTEIQADIAVRRRSCKKSAEGRRQANICHEIMRRIFEYAIELLELNQANPAAFPRMFDERPQTRPLLSDKNLAAIWRGLDGVEGVQEARAIGCKLHFLTLQRPCEIIRAHQDDFDWEKEEWRPRAVSTKSREVYYVPLSREAAQLFRKLFELSGTEWAFPSEFRSRNSDDDESILRTVFITVRDKLFAEGVIDTNDIDLYDGRRLGRTLIRKRLSFDKEVAERVINHRPRRHISNVYDLDDYADEIKAAQLSWSAEVMKIVNGRSMSASEAEAQ